jgi:hypothetical protein
LSYEDLLVGVAGRDGARVLEEAVAQGAFAVVDVGDDAEVAVALDGDGLDAFLDLGGPAQFGPVFEEATGCGCGAGGAPLRP